MTDVARRVAVVLVAALVVTSVGAATMPATAQEEDDDGVDLPTADEIFVEDDGDAVLVYRNESEDADVRLGLDVGSNLFHALVVAEPDGGTGDIQGSATAVLTRDSLVGNGSLAAPRPDAISQLSMEVSGQSTDENARFDATASATIDARNFSAAAIAEQARVRGNVTRTATRFRAAAEADVSLTTPLGQPQHQEFTITEDDGSYTVDASQEFAVREFAKERWNTSERAKRTLEAQFGSIARSLGGSSEITIDSYEFSRASAGDSYRLDIEYTIDYEDIEAGLARQLTTALASSEDIQLNESQLSSIRERVQRLNVDELHVSLDQSAGSVNAAFRMDLRNYDEVVFAALDVADAVETDTGNVGAQLSRFRETFAAQQAADLEQRYTFDVRLESESRTATTLEAEATYRTSNWAAYRDELADRGIQTANTTYDLRARTEDDRVVANASFEVSGRNLVGQATDSLLNATQGGDERARAAIRAFRNAGFRKARMDVSLQDGTVRVEAGAVFEDLSTLRDALAVSGSAPAIDSVVSRTEQGTTVSYVRVNGAVGGNATESDVSALPYVGEDTTVHLPGTWDRTFPEMDTEGAREYLGLSPTPSPTPTPSETGGETGTTGGSGPGFGVAVALVALLAAALLAVRRR